MMDGGWWMVYHGGVVHREKEKIFALVDRLLSQQRLLKLESVIANERG
jgi:hypothetical protein